MVNSDVQKHVQQKYVVCDVQSAGQTSKNEVIKFSIAVLETVKKLIIRAVEIRKYVS